MIVKSETGECVICNRFKYFWRDLKNDESYAILVLISSIIFIIFIIFSTIHLFDYMSKLSKYDIIISKKPIIKCADGEAIPNTNYKVLLVDKTPLIKVFYSDTNIKSYSVSECSIIQEVMNANLGKDTVKTTNTELIKRIKALKSTLSTRNSQITNLKKTNSQIKSNYKLPTQKQLEVLYDKFKKTKRKDIEQYLLLLQQEERKKLAEARAENPDTAECDKDDQACLDLEYDVWQ